MNTFTVSADPMSFTIANPAANNQPQIYSGVTATLTITITNNTGGDISMAPGNSATASQVEVFMPNYFTTTEKSVMTITGISQTGWTFTYDSAYKGLLLSFTGSSGVWVNGTDLTFTINNVTASAAPTSDNVKISLFNLKGSNIPSSMQQPLSLGNATPPASVDLTTVLSVSLDNQGTVFVSTALDPLSNTIYLNFKNTSDNPLYNDTQIWTGNPVVTVSFVYGDTAGSLASDDNGGAAWGISVAASTNQNWGFSNPVNTGQGNSPVWTLYPNPSNKDIIGTGDNANLTFAFSNINSFTPAGHTQMYVQFSGFQANSTTQYKTALYILDISKQNPPPTRGLFSFFGTSTNATDASVIELTAPASNIQIPLKWSMFYVDNIKLICNVPGVQLLSRNYFRSDQTPNIQPLNYDTYVLTIPILITQDTPVFITLQAFDNTGAYLNAMQYTVFISANFFVDAAGQVYPTLFINGQTWLAGNFNFHSESGCVAYDNNNGNRTKYGLLYTEAAAQANTPAGWRIPTQADWKNLISSLGSDAYATLTKSNGFNAQLGGMGDGMGNFNSLNATGYYWTSTNDTQNIGNNFDAVFFSANSSVNANNSIATNALLSVRYVKNT
jgi:uncharacterized protein (TIGR02145 family)